MRFFRGQPKEDLRGRWSDVFKTLSIVVALYLILRWALIEPFVIPSGSMKPNLLIQDYVMVNKWAYGLRLPLTEKWLVGPKVPHRGDVVVFRSKEDSFHFLVKRVVGLPGEKVVVDSQGKISINGQPFEYSPVEGDSDFTRFRENNGRKEYLVQYEPDKIDDQVFDIQVPEGEILMMGDNRDHSLDGRFWGTLPLQKILGQVSFIWMSCENSDQVATFLCPPENFRLQRIFKVVP